MDEFVCTDNTRLLSAAASSATERVVAMAAADGCGVVRCGFYDRDLSTQHNSAVPCPFVFADVVAFAGVVRFIVVRAESTVAK